MKKNFLFSMLAVLLAGFWFGGASLANEVDCTNGNPEAKIGETCYDTLTAAITAAQDGGTVTLLKDVDRSVSLNENKSITLDLDGKTITRNTTAVSISAGTLTVQGNGSIDVTSTGSNVFNVSGGGKLFVKNGTFTGGGGVYVKGNGSEATIIDGRFMGLRSGNSALMHATNSGKLTILTGYFKGMPTGSGKPQKVIYAGGNGNYCDSRSTIMADSGYRIGGTVIVKGGTLIGRVSLSNEGIYDIQRGTFTLYGNLTAGVGCVYSVCESDGTGDPQCNDNAPGIENMLGEGYVGVPKGTNEDGSIYEVVYDPVATIGENGYSTVTGAITAAQDDDIIEIVKAGNSYTLPASIDKKITIKKGSNLSELDDVVINISGAGKANGEALVTLTKDITFEGLTINFVSTDDWKYLNNTTKVTMKHCKIQGVMYVRGNMDFEDCTFEGASSDAYQIHINYGNVNFSGCTFNTEAKRFINIAWGGDGEYTINFKNSTFSTTATAVKKAAVMVHELRGAYATYDPFDFRPVTDFEIIGGKDYGKGKWNLIFDNTVIADGSNFSDAYIGNSQLFGVDTVYVNDFDGTTYTYAAPVDPTDGGVNLDYLGSENGGEVNVTVNGTKVYSTPKRGQTWAVTFDGTGAVEVADGAKVAQPADPSKSCYHFDGWTTDGSTAYDFNSVVTGDLALTSKWTYTCGSSSSSSSSSSKKTTTKVDDNKTTTEEVNTEDKTEENNDEAKTEETLPQLASQEELQNPEAQDWYDNEGDQQEVLEDGLTREMHNAYEFAVRAGITTMPSATEADMLSPLNRIAMAKMLVYYAINVLGMTPDTSKEVPNFGDVSEQLNKDYGNAVTLAYQLGIMGIGITDFRPFDEVPRMEFATALSRMLYGTADGEGDNYYEPHLQKLMSEGIITNDNPRLDELRGYVMIMLMRSANK